ncbi:MAG: 2-oxoacid:acceptor oxidoreductase subunit alpha [Myxococcales bacterium]|nr:2-oxoacid:acceptor oxidoreductase subunit alpha [Myxococcales bacterium]MDD9970097.1 2-oxoacid:acceptor oxidoreductase subunit alpha [Myxococcales bacterium]
MDKAVQTVETVAIRFAGDSGDGMQLTGTQFSDTTALAGNDLATFPDFPAEIRAPAGSLAGVSGFQINFSSVAVHTPGDQPDVLVAMNPAALRVNLPDLRHGGILIANSEQFTKKNLKRAGYEANPLEDGTLKNYRVFSADITGMTLKSIEELRLNTRAAVRCKNFFALGLVYWLYNRDMAHTEGWINNKFKEPLLAQANLRALRAGYNFGETTEMFEQHYEVQRAQIEPGVYRSITGNEALGLGFLAAAELSGLGLFLGSYPITPASDILHFLARHKGLGVRTFQAEDEIAAACAAIGAAYAGGLALTTTSGPGLALKAEAIGLAHILEVPLVIVDVQRGGPSTGLPTKTEQADLMQALFGRNGEAPVPVVAPQSAGDCFYTAIEACRIAIRYMTPVLLLSDGYIANSSEPWPIPDMSKIPPIDVQFRTDPEGYMPYQRDKRGARPWAIPGVPGLEHRIGGLEKEDLTGDISYDPQNHERMVKLRSEKVMNVAADLPPTEVFGDESGTLVVGWGSTFGAIRAGVQQMRARGHKIAHVHLRHLHPFKRDLSDVIGRYERVLVPELNNGQLVKLLRSAFLVDAVSLPKIEGQPYKEREIVEALATHLEAN